MTPGGALELEGHQRWTLSVARRKLYDLRAGPSSVTGCQGRTERATPVSSSSHLAKSSGWGKLPMLAANAPLRGWGHWLLRSFWVEQEGPPP